MIEITKNKVIISRNKWEELRNDVYFRELIEILEDSEELEKAKKNTKYFVDFKEYDRKRKAKMKNVRTKALK